MLNGYLGAKHLDYTALSPPLDHTRRPLFGKKNLFLSLRVPCVYLTSFVWDRSRCSLVIKARGVVFKSILPQEEAGPVSKTSAIC